MTHSQLIRRMVVSSRPVSWVNTAFPFAAGYLATGGEINLYFWLATFYFLVPYNFLVYIVNDVYDYESDRNNPRKNSIEGGILPPSTHRFMLTTTAVGNSIVVACLFFFGSLAANILLALVIFSAISYSAPPLRFKERPVVDSINSSFHFVGPLITAMVYTGWDMSYSLVVVAFFLWGCASHAFGAVQDILPDRAARISSVATHFGAKATVRLSLALYTLTVACVAALGWPAVLACIPLLLYVAMVLPFTNLSDANSEQANKGWRKFMVLNQFTGLVITLLLLTAFLYHSLISSLLYIIDIV